MKKEWQSEGSHVSPCRGECCIEKSLHLPSSPLPPRRSAGGSRTPAPLGLASTLAEGGGPPI